MKNIFTLAFVFVLSIQCISQDTYSVGLTNPSVVVGSRRSCRTMDGGFAIASSGTTPQSLLIVRTDSAGNVRWSQEVSHPDFATISNIIETTDSGIVALGVKYNSVGFGNIYFEKFDVNGNFVWSKQVIAGQGTNGASAFCRSENAGFALSGSGCGGNNFVIRFDANADIIWSKQFPATGASNGCPNSMTRRKNGNFLIAGYEMVSTVRKLAVFEVDTAGTLLWYHDYNDGNEYWPETICEGPDQSVSVSGKVMCSTNPAIPSFMMKLDSAGSYLWMNQYTSTAPICISSHAPLPSGAFVACGSRYDPNWPIANDYLAFHVDTAGTATWGYWDGSTLGNHAAADWSNGVHAAIDGSAFILNESYYDGIAIVRLDPMGNGFCAPTAITINTAPALPVISTPGNSSSNLPLQTASFTVTITGLTLTRTVFCSNNALGVEETQPGAPEISTAPGQLVLGNFHGTRVSRLEIFDLTGKCIHVMDDPAEFSTVNIPVLSPGIYVAGFTTDAGFVTRKLFADAR